MQNETKNQEASKAIYATAPLSHNRNIPLVRALRAAGVGWVRSLSPAAIVVAVQQKEFAIAAEASLASDKPAGVIEAWTGLGRRHEKIKPEIFLIRNASVENDRRS